MPFPHFPKRKANAIGNGVFFILLGVLFYTEQWWPGILFALLASLAFRQFLSGRRVDFFVTIVIIGLIGFLSLAGKIFSFLFPFVFLALGLYFILKECLSFKKSNHPFAE